MFNLIQCVDKIAFSILGIDIAWYGIIVTTGIISAFFLFMKIAKIQNLDDDFILETFIWVLILAIIFARVFYVVPRIGSEYTTFKEMINIREGGLTIVGGIFGGFFGAVCAVLRNKKYHLATVVDAIPLPLLLGQIIGRWGNFVNQELFGLPINNPSFQHFPFAVYIDYPGFHYPGYEAGWYCALFFYEGVINAIGLVVGAIVFKKYKDKLKPGTMTIAYLIWYGLVRGSLEFLKIDHATLPNTNIGTIQLICYLMAIVGIVLMVLLYLNKIKLTSDKFALICEKHLKELELNKVNANENEQETTIENSNDKNAIVDSENIDINDKKDEKE